VQNDGEFDCLLKGVILKTGVFLLVPIVLGENPYLTNSYQYIIKYKLMNNFGYRSSYIHSHRRRWEWA